MSENLHRVDFRRTERGHSIEFTCLGDESSNCHIYSNCACEFWGEDHPHPKVPHAECWMQSWFNSDSAGYDGDDMTDCGCTSEGCPPADRSGFITVSLEDEWIQWRFIADPEPSFHGTGLGFL